MSDYIYPESELREEVYRMRNGLSVGTQVSDHEAMGDIAPDSYNIPKAIIDVALSGDYANHPKLYRTGVVQICNNAGYPVPVHIARGGDFNLLEQSVQHALRHLAEIHAVTVDELIGMWNNGEYTFGNEYISPDDCFASHRIGEFEVNGVIYSAADITSIEFDGGKVKITLAIDVLEFPFSDVHALAQVFNAIVEVSEHTGYSAPTNANVEVEGRSVMLDALTQMGDAIKSGDIGHSRDIMNDASKFMREQGNCDASEIRAMMGMFNDMGAGVVTEQKVSIFDQAMIDSSVQRYNESMPPVSQIDHYDQIDEDMKATLYNRYVEEVANA